MNIVILRKAVIFHLYYQEMWNIFVPYLKNLEEISGFDLYITTTVENKVLFAEIENTFSNSVNVQIKVVENLGADLYPFIEILNSINLEDYDIIYKIHTKRELKQRVKLDGINCGLIYWRDFLLNDILSKNTIKERLQDFIDNPQLGINGFYPYLINVKADSKKYGPGTNFKIYNDQCGLKTIGSYKFYAGTMLMIRPCILKCIQHKFDKSNFVKKQNEKFPGFAYFLEAYLGYIVEVQGYEYKQGNNLQKSILKLLSHRITYPLFRYYADNIILKK